MQLNRNNYEQYMIDYFDGQLSPVDTACLMAFLEENPDIKEEIEGYESICLNDSAELVFPEKNQMKRSIVPEQDIITEFNYLQIFFNDAEGKLDDEMHQHLLAFLHKNPSLQFEYYSWRNAHLIPETLIFDRKAKLKKSTLFPLYRREYVFAGMAATLALLIVSGIVFFRGMSTQPPPAMAFESSQAMFHSRGAHAQANLNNGHQGMNSTALITEPHQQKKNPTPQYVTQPLMARQSLEISEMPSKPVYAGLTDVSSVLPDRLNNDQTEYTDIMELMAIRQMIREQEKGRTEFADKPSQEKVSDTPADNENPGKSRFSLWNIADIGVAGYNAFAEKDIKYQRRIDAEGRTSAISLGAFAYEKK